MPKLPILAGRVVIAVLERLGFEMFAGVEVTLFLKEAPLEPTFA